MQKLSWVPQRADFTADRQGWIAGSESKTRKRMQQGYDEVFVVDRRGETVSGQKSDWVEEETKICPSTADGRVYRHWVQPRRSLNKQNWLLAVAFNRSFATGQVQNNEHYKSDNHEGPESDLVDRHESLKVLWDSQNRACTWNLFDSGKSRCTTKGYSDEVTKQES